MVQSGAYDSASSHCTPAGTPGLHESRLLCAARYQPKEVPGPANTRAPRLGSVRVCELCLQDSEGAVVSATGVCCLDSESASR